MKNSENELTTPRFTAFIDAVTDLLEQHPEDETTLLTALTPLLKELLTQHDWLPPRYLVPDANQYRQYLLYCDPQQRFSVVSFVWGPGQQTPIHDHCTWGLLGVYQGMEQCEEFELTRHGSLLAGTTHQLNSGEIDRVSPQLGDIHRVSNALPDQTSVSIHL